jgi:hypothetical protein
MMSITNQWLFVNEELYLTLDYSVSFTVLTTFSTVKPKCSINTPPGADSPNVSIPTTASSKPTYLRQKSVEGINVRVVSMPSTNVFDRQDQAYKDSVLTPGVKRIAVEAGVKIRCRVLSTCSHERTGK